MPKECAWPKGCAQRAMACCGTASHGKHGLCDYHDSVLAGHISVEGMVRVAPERYRHKGLNRAAVIDDDQRELAGMLRALGANPEVVKRALTRYKRPPMR